MRIFNDSQISNYLTLKDIISLAEACSSPIPTAAVPEDEGETSAKRSDSVTLSPEGKALSANAGKEALSESEQRQVEKLRQRDAHVRAHEQAHLSAGAGLTTGGAKFKYQTGPDGKQYAVGGEVGLKMPSGSNPEENLRIAMQVERAALAPSDPSPQDRAVANKARAKETEARQDISEKNVERMKGNGVKPVVKENANNEKPEDGTRTAGNAETVNETIEKKIAYYHKTGNYSFVEGESGKVSYVV